MLKGINWVGVVAALIYGQVLGFVWYGMLFGEKLAASMSPDGNTPLVRIEGMVVALVMLVGLAWILGKMGATTLVQGAMTGAIIWAVLPFCGEIQNKLYMNESADLFFANSGYELLFLAVSGALICGLKLGGAKTAAA